MDPLRCALGLSTEDEVVACLEPGIPDATFSLGCEKPGPGRAFGSQKRIPIIVLMAVNEVPVVKTCPSTRFFRHVEAQWMYHMQATGRGSGRTADVPSVVWDLRLDQNDIERVGWHWGKSSVRWMQGCRYS